MPQPDHVTALQPADEGALPDDLRPYFQKCRDKLGFVPNVLRAFLLRPEKLRTFIRTYLVYDGDTVPESLIRARYESSIDPEVVEAFGDTVFQTVIARTVRFPETTVAGQPITAWASTSSGAQAYRDLAKEVLAL